MDVSVLYNSYRSIELTNRQSEPSASGEDENETHSQVEERDDAQRASAPIAGPSDETSALPPPTVRALDDPAVDPSSNTTSPPQPAIPPSPSDAITPQAPHHDVNSTAEDTLDPPLRDPLDHHANYHGLGGPVDGSLASSPMTQPMLDEYELTSVTTARSAQRRARDNDGRSTVELETGKSEPRSSLFVAHSQSVDDPPSVLDTSSTTAGGSQPAPQESALEELGPEDEETHSLHTSTPPPAHTVTDATLDAPSKEEAVESGPVASRPPHPPANEPDVPLPRTSSSLSEPSSSVRAPGAGADDPRPIDTTLRDLEAGPDIPSPVEVTSELA